MILFWEFLTFSRSFQPKNAFDSYNFFIVDRQGDHISKLLLKICLLSRYMILFHEHAVMVKKYILLFVMLGYE